MSGLLTIFVCDPEAALYREMERQSRLDDERWIEEADRDEDEELRVAHDPEVDAWPWWLPSAHEVEEPEVFEGMFEVLADDEAEDDEWGS